MHCKYSRERSNQNINIMTLFTGIVPEQIVVHRRKKKSIISNHFAQLTAPGEEKIKEQKNSLPW